MVKGWLTIHEQCGKEDRLISRQQPDRGEADMSSERRSSARQKSFLQGRVFFNNRRNSIDCLVRDISDLGAKLIFAGTVTIPEVVDLYIPNKDELRRATVQWRFAEEVGVAFDADDAPSLVPPAAPRGTDVVGRIQQLEKDVATLQRKLNEMHAEMRRLQGADS